MNKGKLRQIWTTEYTPMIMGGSCDHVITTEIGVIEEKAVGKGLRAFSFMTPKGTLRIAESISGAIVGNSFKEVMADIKGTTKKICMQQIGEGQVLLARSSTQHLTKEVFFQHYKY